MYSLPDYREVIYLFIYVTAKTTLAQFRKSSAQVVPWGNNTHNSNWPTEYREISILHQQEVEELAVNTSGKALTYASIQHDVYFSITC